MTLLLNSHSKCVLLPRQRDVEIVGVKDSKDPEDGYEDNLDHELSQDSPRGKTRLR